jgi:hypothetical protein
MFIIRNDDVAVDTRLSEITRFCEICDKYGIKIIQAITVVGECKKAHTSLSNEEIKAGADTGFAQNYDVVNFLLQRQDFIGVHGLYHTHQPTEKEIKLAKEALELMGFKPTYFVPPFNQGDYKDEVCGLKTIKLSMEQGERLEDYLMGGAPTAPIVYLHSWRFDDDWYSWEQLDNCLKRIYDKEIE